MEAGRKFSRTPRRLPSCSDVSVLQKTRMSHYWDTHHMTRTGTEENLKKKKNLEFARNRPLESQ